MVFNLARFSALAAADTLQSIDDETIQLRSWTGESLLGKPSRFPGNPARQQ